MRGHFSIEWMAQSSQPAGLETSTSPASGPAAWGTHSESLPGFYHKLKSESLPEHQHLNTPNQNAKQDQSAPRTQDMSQSSLSVENQGEIIMEGEFLSDSPTQCITAAAAEAGFSSGTEEETSGYESEGCPSLSSSTHTNCTSTSPPSPPVGRRPRTAFTAEQISSLERAFKKNAYLGTQDKAELCKKLNLSDKQIRNWFQNRRMKLKRTVQDALAHACQANMASQMIHYPELQTYRPGPYPRYYSAVGSEPQTPTSYVHPHSHQYSSPLPSSSSLPSFYQYNSLPGATLPSSHLRAPYPSYYC